MSILSTGKYRIKGKISEQNIGELQPGMDVTVRARNNQEEIWKGSVRDYRICRNLGLPVFI